MEGGNGATPSLADELFGRKDAGNKSKLSLADQLFPLLPPSDVMPKDSSQSDLFWTSIKQKTDGQIRNAQGAVSDGKSQGSPSKVQSPLITGDKPIYPDESEESSHFGSCVHYGARDFYVRSPSKQVSETPKTYKADEGGNSSGDQNISYRGDWWQGSVYY